MRNTSPVPALHLLDSPGWKDYSLLDSGDGLKLERFGPYTFVRPEVQAIWKPALPQAEWNAAHAVFISTGEEHGGHWQFHKEVPPDWVMQYGNLRFKVQTSAARHLGVFPEQASQWDWIAGLIEEAAKPVKVLNLFGYTGLATLAAASAGASVTHVDASKKSVAWARENQALSGLGDRPVRWLVDDAVKFVERESRRGARYEGIILDPPKFGRGPKGEVWEFFKLFPYLLENCCDLLSDNALFIALTAYAVKSSALTLYYGMQAGLEKRQGKLSCGEIVTVEKSAGRMISHAIYARWSSRL